MNNTTGVGLRRWLATAMPPVNSRARVQATSSPLRQCYPDSSMLCSSDGGTCLRLAHPARSSPALHPQATTPPQLPVLVFHSPRAACGSCSQQCTAWINACDLLCLSVTIPHDSRRTPAAICHPRRTFAVRPDHTNIPLNLSEPSRKFWLCVD